MSKSLQDIYRGKLFSLSKTLIFKCVESAVATNRWLEENGYYVDWENPKSWKYYLNLSGQYHQFDKDLLKEEGGFIPVKVAGVNGPVTTAFTKELISENNADLGTAAEYAYGTKSYKDLVKKYKLLEPLILGILYSVDLDIAVKAPNWTILHIGGYYIKDFPKYDGMYVYHTKENDLLETLIEEQEVNLIPELQKYITNTMERWITPEYTMVDNLYLAACIGNLAAMIPITIANIRLSNCKTNLAHSFYIYQYMDSYGYLGKYVQYLNLKEQLWLYRNTDWLSNNFGKIRTFKAIVDNVLTPSNVPLVGYRGLHNVTHMGSDNLYSDPKLIMDVINFKQSGTGATIFSVRDILDKEANLARENTYDIDNVENTITKGFNRAKYNNVPTKLLESIMIDYSDYTPYPLSQMLLNNWIYQSVMGNYKGTIYVTNPYSNERLQLSPLNAFILMSYCFYKGELNVVLDKLPSLHLRMIPKVKGNWTPSDKHLPFPTLTDLKKGTDKKYISEDQLKSLYNDHYFNFNVRSSDMFYKECRKVYAVTMDRHIKVCKTSDMIGRAMMQWALRQYYWDDVVVNLSDKNETYTNWLSRMSINLDNLSKEELLTIADEILIAATGVNSNTENQLRNLQRSCISILKSFSSYTVQFLDSTLISSPAIGDVKTIRFGQYKTSGYSKLRLELPKMDMNLHNTTTYSLNFPLQLTFNEIHSLFNIGNKKFTFVNVAKKVTLRYELGSLNYIDKFNIKKASIHRRILAPLSTFRMSVTLVEP